MTNREIDALIAEKVFGLDPKRLTVSNDGGKGIAAWVDPLNGPWYSNRELTDWFNSSKREGAYRGYALVEIPYPESYSTNIADAWLVAEKMSQDGWAFRVGNSLGDWCVQVRCGITGSHGATEKTAPLAICKAALRAKGVEA